MTSLQLVTDRSPPLTGLGSPVPVAACTFLPPLTPAPPGAVVFSRSCRRHRRLAAVDALAELVPLLATCDQVDLDDCVEEEPAGLRRHVVGVAVGPAAMAAVDGAELHHPLAQELLLGLAG